MVEEQEQSHERAHPDQLSGYARLVRLFADETGWTTVELDVPDRLRAEAGGLDEARLRRRAAAALPRLVELSGAERG